MSASDDVDPELSAFAEALHAYEGLLERAYAAGGQLALCAAQAKASRRISVVATHGALADFSLAHASIGTAIGQVAAGHRRIEALGRALGINVRAYGEGQKPPTEDGGFWTGAKAGDDRVLA